MMTPWNELQTDAQRDRWLADQNTFTQRVEWIKCARQPAYFLHSYVLLFDKVAQRWVPFHLWPAQVQVLQVLQSSLLTIILKARQLGLSWLVVGYHGLWRPLFHPIAKAGLFSRRDDEAVYLLSTERLRGMYERLPPFLQARAVIKADGHMWSLSNGSTVRAFPTSAGDAYALTDAVLDEYDLVPDQAALMSAVKPTVEGGGKMTIVSRADKSRPRTPFKRLYREAAAGRNDWRALFLPWSAHPGRDRAWYEATKRESESRTGSTDELYEQYPETVDQALAPNEQDKRFTAKWLAGGYQKRDPLAESEIAGAGLPAVPGLQVYVLPKDGHKYAVGLDPAEGNPTSDDSAIEVLDRDTGQEVAALAGKYEPSTAAYYCHLLATAYHNAVVWIERNNHGHACLLWFRDHSQLKVAVGEDRRPGWLDTSRGKSILYANGARMLRDGLLIVHSEATFHQLASIEGGSLRAPSGMNDDRADAILLASLACRGTKKEDRKAESWQG